MKKIYFVIGLSVLLWLLHSFFKTIIYYNTGWDELPTTLLDYSFEGISDSTFQFEIESSRHELKEIHKKSKAPALSIAVSVKGEIKWTEALGLQSIQNIIPADTATVFRIGSTSKALTSLVLGRLMEENLIVLDSSIQYYTDYFNDKPRIKIRHLASHQSGIRNYGVCFCFPIWEYYRDKDFLSVEQSLGDFESDELLFQPGDNFHYTSYNFSALSHAMEKASSTDFLELMESKLFLPLNMRSTQPNLKHEKSSKQSTFYEIRNNEFKPSPEINMSNKWAGGGFLSNPSDLVKAGNSILNEGLLSRATINQLIEPQKLNNDSINHQSYALGWRHNYTYDFLDGNRKVEIIHHGGMALGSQSLLVVFPEYDMVVSLLMNKSGEEGQFKLFDYLKPIVNIFLSKLEMTK